MTFYTASHRPAQDRFGNVARPRSPARQIWAAGQTVNVGFLKGLTVTGRNSHGEYTLISAKGVRYEFQPHAGIRRVNAQG